MEHKKKNIKYLIYAIIIVIILIIAAVAATYAFFRVDSDYDSTIGNVNSSMACIDLDLSSTGSIELNYDYPITDTLALSEGTMTPITVTVTNNCSVENYYTLTLSSMGLTETIANYVDDSKIRYYVVKNNSAYTGIDYISNLPIITTSSEVYTDLAGTDGELATKFPNYTVKEMYAIDDTAIIGVNESVTYEIYLWVDYYEGDADAYLGMEHKTRYDGTTEGKNFAAAISLSFNSSAQKNAASRNYSVILETDPTNLSDQLVGGLYRYQGTASEVDNNYICFGTDDKDACINDTDQYLYRIIGLTENGQLKLIKSEALNTTYMWYNSSSANVSWANSDLFKGLNGIDGGTYTDLFVNSSNYSYMSDTSDWYYKIANTSWKYGDLRTKNVTADEMFALENAFSDVVSSKIGLIYLNDYYYILGATTNCNSSYVCDTGWIHLANNDSSAPNGAEWTMSRYGANGSYYDAWYISSGSPAYSYPYGTYGYAVRPVFYLSNNVSIVDGTGIISNPYIVN